MDQDVGRADLPARRGSGRPPSSTEARRHVLNHDQRWRQPGSAPALALPEMVTPRYGNIQMMRMRCGCEGSYR